MAKTTKNKDINLLTALERGKQKKKRGKGIAVIATLIIACCAVVALFFAYSIHATDGIAARLEVALSYTSNPAITAQYEESLKKTGESSAMEAMASSLNGSVNAIESYPDMTRDKFEKLFDIAGKNVELSNIGFDRSTGVLSFGAKCGSAARVPVFVSALRSSGMFSDVSYDGYAGASYSKAGEPQKNESGELTPTQTTAMEFSFNVVCIVKADEGAAPTDEAAAPANE